MKVKKSTVHNTSLPLYDSLPVNNFNRTDNLYKNIFDNAQDIIFHISLDGTVLLLNRGGERILGYSSESLLNINIQALLPPESNSELAEILNSVKQGIYVEAFETVFINKEGRYIKVSATISPVRDDNNIITGASIIARDITVKKQLDLILREKKYNYNYNADKQNDNFLQRLASIIESSEDAIISKDLDGIITSWNRGAELIYGYSALEAIGKHITIIIPDFLVKEEDEILSKIRRGEKVEHFETIRKNKDGTLLNISLTISPLRDNQGKITGASKIARNITARKLIERDLIASEEKYRRLTELLPVGMFVTNLDGLLTFYNNKAAEIWGRNPELNDPAELKYCGAFKVFDFDGVQLERYNCPVAISLKNKDHVKNQECIIEKPDGTRVHALMNSELIYDVNGKITGALTVLQDITDRKKYENAIKEMQLRFSFLADISKILSSSLDYHSTISEIASLAVPAIADWCNIIVSNENNNYERVALAHSDPQKLALAEEVSRLYPVESLPFSIINVAIESGKPALYNEKELSSFTEKLSDNYIKDFTRQLGFKSAIIIPLLSGQNVTGVISFYYSDSGRNYTNDDLIFAEEIASRCVLAIQNSRLYIEAQSLNKELDKRVKVRTAQLQAANQELETYTFSISHDLKAPLRHIAGYIELLQQNFLNNINDQSKYLLEKVHTSAKRMQSMIDDILAFSKISRVEMQIVEIDMNILVNEVVAGFRHQQEQRSIEWNISFLPVIFADRAMMRVVLINLISNAVKFTRNNPHGKIEITSYYTGTEHVFSIADNGAGFDMKYVNKLFTVFQRLHKYEEYEGEGIGLAHVQKIIQRHGGRTWAVGEPGRGASFSFALPDLT